MAQPRGGNTKSIFMSTFPLTYIKYKICFNEKQALCKKVYYYVASCYLGKTCKNLRFKAKRSVDRIMEITEMWKNNFQALVIVQQNKCFHNFGLIFVPKKGTFIFEVDV